MTFFKAVTTTPFYSSFSARSLLAVLLVTASAVVYLSSIRLLFSQHESHIQIINNELRPPTRLLAKIKLRNYEALISRRKMAICVIFIYLSQKINSTTSSVHYERFFFFLYRANANDRTFYLISRNYYEYVKKCRKP